MTGARLFVRSRRWHVVLLVIAATSALVAVVGHYTYTLHPRGALIITVAGQLPVVPAIAIQATLEPGLHRQELTAVRRLRRWHVLHVTVLAAAGTLGILIATGAAGGTLETLGANPGTALARNFLALLGAALVGAFIFGPVFAWIVPMAWMILPSLVIAQPEQDPVGILTLTTQDGSATVPLLFAGAIWIVGVALASAAPRYRG